MGIEELARSDWMGLSGGDQSWRINSSHSIIEEFARFARSDWMGSSGGDQSGRINSSHSMIHKFARFARSDWMRLSGGDQSERRNSSHSIIDHFSRCQNNFSTCQNLKKTKFIFFLKKSNKKFGGKKNWNKKKFRKKIP